MSSSDDQAAKVSAALQHLRGEPAQLVNTAGHPVPLSEGPGGGLRATTAPVGRVIVGPAQSVDPDTWGNVVYDQTMMTFASEITRDQQWGAPLEGGRCYLMNQQRTYTRRGLQWRTDPLGYMAAITGPPSALNGPSGQLVVHSFQAIGGRRYLIEATASASNVAPTYTGLPPRCWLVTPTAAQRFLWYAVANQPAGSANTGYAWMVHTAGGLAESIGVSIQAQGNWQNFAANSARLVVTEIGGNP